MDTYIYYTNFNLIVRGDINKSELNNFDSHFNQLHISLNVEDLNDLFTQLLSYLSVPKGDYDDVCFYAISDTENKLLCAWIAPRVKLEELDDCLLQQGHIYEFHNYIVKKTGGMRKLIKPNKLKKALSYLPTVMSTGNNSLDFSSCEYLTYKEKSDKVSKIVSIKPVDNSIEGDECVNVEPKTKTHSLDLCNIDSYVDDPRYKEFFNHLNISFKLLDELKETIPDLNRTVHLCDLETLNILHNIELEFDKMNAYQGWLACKKIHEIRVRRRVAKDKREILEQVYEPYKALYELSEDLLSNLENRKYNKRNTKGMFDEEKLFEKSLDLDSENLNEKILEEESI